MSDIKLKPCPFCGGEGHIHIDYHWSDATKGPLTVYHAGCGTYRCRGEFGSMSGYLHAEEAAEAWNTRVPWFKKLWKLFQ